ncbi:MAG: twin-arginine translocase TatA/TatE family subunit [Clostridia bacterium]|nr:twin-arginine translocase TatA/TatE family subunit [Clostridia bacterium]
MFNLGMMEILLVLAVAFLVVGPKDLPRVARWIARQIKSLKKLIREVKKETGWDEFAKEFKDVADDVKSTVKDADIRKDVQESADELRAAMEGVRADVDFASRELKKDIEA